MKPWIVYLAVVVFCVKPADAAQAPQGAPAGGGGTPPASVIVHYRQTISVESDGRERRDVTARIKVNTDAGREDVGTVRLEYERGTSVLAIQYVRVRKSSGEIVETSIESAIDVPADSTREAPMYSDAYQRHVNVRGLVVGDTLEYAYRIDRQPMFPGHVAFEEEWLMGEVVEDGEVVLSAPSSMPLIVKTHGPQPKVETRDGRRVHVWTVSRAKELTSDDIAALVHERRSRRPAVQVTSFASWDAVGAAMKDLWRARAEVTPSIAEKAAALTAKSSDRDERIRALYRYVANDVRYVAIAFGIGRLQPRTANDVLSNGFGDCKDKHVLLEALLRAVGIESEPALIGVGQFLDADVPSFAQFDHVITRVANANTELWMDATLEVAPAGYLMFPERNRQTLLLPTAGRATLVRTPAEPLRPNVTRLHFDAAIDASGTLTGTVEETYSGDLEYAIRLGLRMVPESRRAEALQGRNLSGLPGEAADLTFSSLEDVSGPLRATYKITAKNYSGWTTGAINVPLPDAKLPERPTGTASAKPMVFGLTLRSVMSVRLRFPDGYIASIGGKPPFEEAASNEYFDFRRRTASENGELIVERSLAILRDEIPADRIAAYDEIHTALSARAPWVTIRDSWPWTSTSSPRFGSHAGKNPAATQLVTQALRSGNAAAIGLLRKAVEIEPDHPMAWSYLGEQITYTGELEEGERLMRKQLDVAPSADAYKRIATTFLRHVRYPIAERALREGTERYPDDRDLSAMLGEVLLSQGKNAEAATVLQAEVEKRPRSSRLQSTLGRAYVRSGQLEKGVAAIHQSVVLEAGPNIWALAGRELLTADRDLDRALDYADRAVKRTFAENATAEFARLPSGSTDAPRRLAFYMETLGRILLRQKQHDRAEAYCRASFELAGRNGAASCLADLAANRGDKKSAEMFRMHAATPSGFGSTYLPAGEFDFGPTISRPSSPAEAELRVAAFRERTAARTFPVPRPENASGTADFDLLTGPDGRVREARTVSATPAFEAIVGDLLNMKIGPQLPEGAEARLVRRVRVRCDQPGPSCSMSVTE